MAHTDNHSTLFFTLNKGAVDLDLILGVDRQQGQGVGSHHRITVGFHIEEIVAFIHVLIQLPVGTDTLSEKGAVEVKLVDRLKALELLAEIADENGGDLEGFLKSLQEDAP
jgi:hypothetical protein